MHDGDVKSWEYQETFTISRELIPSITKRAEIDHFDITTIETGPETVTVQITAHLHQGTIIGVHANDTWTPNPGWVHPPDPSPATPTCILCHGQRHHRRFLYIATPILDANHPQWVGAACALRNPNLRHIKEPQPFRNIATAVNSFPHEKRFDTTRVVAEAMHAIRSQGYVSQAQGARNGQRTTRSRVEAALRDPAAPEIEHLYLESQMTLMLFGEIEPEDDFTAQMQYCAQLPEITRHSLGLICYLPEKYARDRLNKNVPENPNIHLGKPGERLTRTVICQGTSITATGNTLFRFADMDTGARLVWFAQTANLSQIPRKESFQAKFTVKSHERYRDKNNTIITRLNVT
jgi:hypothetical protein